MNKICSIVGNPLFIYDCTSTMIRVNYARALMEIDIILPLTQEVAVEIVREAIFKHKLKYETMTKYCVKCYKLGHVCARTEKWVWVPNVPISPTVNKPSEVVTTDAPSKVIGSNRDASWQAATK